MKTKYLILTALLGLAFNQPVYAACGSSSSCETRSSCGGSDACSVADNSCAYMNSCNCTDPVCRGHSCLDSRTCCEVYGNLGALTTY